MLPTPTRPINGSDGSNPPTASDDDIGHLITTISNQAICTNGGFGDIFKGVHRTMGEVALKRLKLGGTDNAEQLVRVSFLPILFFGSKSHVSTKRFEREAYTWRRLHHSHILKFLGVLKLEGHLYFVSPFINNGTLLEYIKSRPGTNRVRLVGHYIYQSLVFRLGHPNFRGRITAVPDRKRRSILAPGRRRTWRYQRGQPPHQR